jgi:hypothetical protein
LHTAWFFADLAGKPRVSSWRKLAILGNEYADSSHADAKIPYNKNAAHGLPPAKRALAGLRYSHELAGPIMEDLDPYEWGATSPNPCVNDPEGLVLPLRRPQR